MKLAWPFIIIAIVATLLLAIMFDWTSPQFQENKAEKTQTILNSMLPENKTAYKKESFELLAPHYLQRGTEQMATRVYIDNKPSLIILSALTKEAYNGTLGMMVSFDTECTIVNTAVLSEQETPGLGDQYKSNNFAWLHTLKQRTTDTIWKLKKHQGDIDGWTGATITPKAMVKLIDRVQQLCINHGDALFSNQELLYFEQTKPDTDYP